MSRRKYDIKLIDTAGKAGKEPKLISSFWRKNRVADVMTLSQEELDTIIDKYLDDYAANMIKRNKHWWYPSIALVTPKSSKKYVDKSPKLY